MSMVQCFDFIANKELEVKREDYKFFEVIMTDHVMSINHDIEKYHQRYSCP